MKNDPNNEILMEILGSIFMYMKEIPEELDEIDPDWATP